MITLLLPFLSAVASRMLFLALHLEPSRFPQPLSLREEQAAFEAMARGDPNARNTLISHNLRLVAHIAKKYYATGADQDDLVSIGTIGLIKAVETFDPARSRRFSTYASRCIENELLMKFRHSRRAPPMVSLQEPIESGRDGALTMMDVIPDEKPMAEDVELRDMARWLRGALTTLPARERMILSLRYGLEGQPPRTQLQVAEQLGLSRSYVSRLESRALAKLRKHP